MRIYTMLGLKDLQKTNHSISISLLMRDNLNKQYKIVVVILFLFVVGLVLSQLGLFRINSAIHGLEKDLTSSFSPVNQTTRQEITTVSQNFLYPSVTPTSIIFIYPAQVLNLREWKITLPFGRDKHPVEIRQPALARYKSIPWFSVSADGRAVQFRAPVSAVSTSGSNYPRSELREMENNGKTNASWSSMNGIHTLFIDEAITAVPTTKPHVVAGQIHDSSDDIIVIRLEMPYLYVNVGGENKSVLDSHYTLGKRFSVKFEVQNGQTNVYYNGKNTPSYTLLKNYSRAYFKAGAYTQSNCTRERLESLCNENNYGEVLVYQLSVTHR